ncbi:MurR/RpiR family transcriptional regulator [Aureimonas fodinaquatilis]|uniref:MurR/RpiR family transcriptional regulator n=1 Tax=Aureimonas fodinaquatilis TaxID=2565783 RepID=A0A5B0DZP5_9HYPH|nr:MurR/RpiR family transcriptional regulator [Aureimonas fodinaquatilis]KAA0971848.1 MurR/RpiR family transcriptional regulator [Aureimonas fodinaquatilis]
MTDFLDRIAAPSVRLTETERKIVDALVEERHETVFLSGPQLAERLNVHEAAATRLAQKLGYRGYPQLRASLQKELMSGQDAAMRMRRSVKMAGAKGYLEDLIASEILALETLLQTISQEEIDRAADMISQARRILLFGQGHAWSILSFLQRRLDRFGMTTIALSGRSRDIAERVVSLGPDDLVIAMAFRNQPEGYRPLMEHARAVSAKTILVSDLSGSSMQPRPDMILAAPRGRSGSEFQTPTVPLAMVNSILLTIAGRHEQQTIGSLEKLSELFKQFD